MSRVQAPGLGGGDPPIAEGQETARQAGRTQPCWPPKLGAVVLLAVRPSAVVCRSVHGIAGS